MKKQISFILLLAVGVGLAVYYFFNRGQSLFGDYMAEQAAENALLAECNYERDFCLYLAAQAKAMSRGVTVETSGQATEAGLVTNKLQLDGVGNMLTETFLDGSLQSRMVVYAGQTYLQDLIDEAWIIMNVDPNQAVTSQDENLYQVNTNWLRPEELDTTLTVNKLSTEPCGDMTCDKYELLSNVEMINPPKTYLWVDTKESLARHMEIIDAEAEPIIMTYRYDEEVSIVKPSPLKDLSSITFPSGGLDSDGSNLPADGQEQMPSEEDLEEMMRLYGLDG